MPVFGPAAQIDQYVLIGDGPLNFNCQVYQDGNPLPLTGGVLPQIVLKSGQGVLDSTGVTFNTVNGGINNVNALAGQFVWTVPAVLLTEPGQLWYHGVIQAQGSVFTWVYGNFFIQAV